MIIRNLPNAAYHADTAIGASGLKLIVNKSPAHYWHEYLNPARVRKEPTPAMMIGTAWHCALFESDEFENRFAPFTGDRRTSVGRDQYAKLAEKFSVLNAADYLRVLDMAKAARKFAEPILTHPGFMAEASIFWADEATGVKCKARPDGMIPPCDEYPAGLIIDGKTNDDSSADGFGRSAINWDMDIQAAMQCDAFMAEYGTSVRPVYLWLSQERDAPYCCKLYEAPTCISEDGFELDFYIEHGRERYQSALRTVAACQASNQWPGYGHEVTPLSLPPYFAKRIMSDAEEVESIRYV